MSVSKKPPKRSPGHDAKMNGRQVTNGFFTINNKFPLLLNAVPSAIVYADNQQRIQYVNTGFEKIFGAKEADVIGKQSLSFLGPDTYNALKTYREDALAGSSSACEVEIYFRGEYKFIKAAYTPDMDEEGAVCGYMIVIDDITEKKKTEKKLKSKQTELEDYVNNGMAGLHWVNAKGIIIWANQVELDMLGYTKEEYIGRPVSEFHVDKGKINENLSRLLSKQSPQQYEAELKHKDGSVSAVLINSNAFWEDDKFIYARCFTTNIQERKRTEEKLQESESHYRALLENIPVAVYTCDADGYVTLFNKAAADLWGREPVTGKDKWCGSWKIFERDGITPLAPDRCPMARAIKEGKAVTGLEIVIELPGGRKRYVQPYPMPLFDRGGKVTGAVNMVIDVTERKEAGKKLAHLAEIVRSSSDAIISKTLSGVITSWNKAAEKLFGYTRQEMIGQPVTKLIPRERLDEETMILERLKKGESIEHYETKRISKDNKQLDISLTISPLKDEEGNIIGASKIARNVTEEKQLQQLVRENEERFRMAIEATQLGTWEFFPLSGQLRWSDECRKIYDAPPDLEITYDFFLAHIHPGDLSFAREKIAAAMDPEKGGNYDIQYRILRYSDKQPRWIRAQGKVYFNSQNQPERFIGTVLDITEEKNEELKLKDSVELFTNMIDNVPAMIWMSGDDRFNDFFNETWLKFTGRTLEQESNEGWLENVHPDDVQKCVQGYNKAFNEQRGNYAEYRLKRYDGQYRWIADNSVPRYDTHGKFTGFISACIDIDDQKNFQDRIAESELRLKTISNAAPVGLWMTDAEAQNIFVNETWIEWTGTSFEQQLGTGWLGSVIEEDKVNAPSLFWKCLLNREKYSTEFRIRRPDGEMRWCLTEGSPYYNMDGDFAGYAGSVTDITDIRKMEERKDDFIKMASHELKTPITSIKGYVQLLLNIYDESNEEKFQSSRSIVKSSLQTISKQVAKLIRLISELLDLSKIESGKLELNKTVFNLADLVEETVQDVRQTTSSHAIIVHNDFEGTCYADKDRISQVLLNLLTNAIKYSPGKDCVEVFVTKKNKTALIEVKDRGIGIEKKDHEKIFQRFYRVEGKSEQTYPGFGIGLFIANEIVQRHEGSISVRSEKNKGSLFSVLLPLHPETNHKTMKENFLR